MSTPEFVFVWLLAVMGLYEVLFAAVSFLFLAPQTKSCGVIELCGRMENAEFLIRSALLHSSGNVYIIDCGADSETLLVAQLLAQAERRIVLLRSEKAAVTLGEDPVN